MPIKVTCEKCGGVLNAPDDAGGKKGRCPNCQNILPIPFDASRAPTFGAAPAAPPAFGGSGVAGPPPGMAFASPAPIGNPLLPNADARRPAAPAPFGTGSRSDVPGMASSTPGLGLNPTYGGSSPGVQSSMPFGAPRQANSAAMPIAPERNGWLSAARGLRWMQIGVVLLALGLVATSGVSIFGAYGGQALADKPGLLKWDGLSQLNELRFATFALPVLLGSIAIALGRWGFVLVPAATMARGAARWSLLFTLLAVVGVLALLGMVTLGMKDGFVPDIHPKGVALAAETTLAARITDYLGITLMPGTEMPGIVQRFGLVALLICGKFAELFFGCALGRVGASLRDPCAGRVTGTYAIFAFIATAIAFGLLAYELFGTGTAKTVWAPKWWGMPTNMRTAIVAGTAIGLVLIGSFMYLRMLGGVRRACRNAGV